MLFVFLLFVVCWLFFFGGEGGKIGEGERGRELLSFGPWHSKSSNQKKGEEEIRDVEFLKLVGYVCSKVMGITFRIPQTDPRYIAPQSVILIVHQPGFYRCLCNTNEIIPY